MYNDYNISAASLARLIHMEGLKKFALDLLFPRRCLGCSEFLAENLPRYLCRSCWKSISFQNGFACAFCLAPVVRAKTCPFCIKGHYLDRFLVTTSYELKLVEKTLKILKYHFVKDVAEDIADLMIKYLKPKIEALALKPGEAVPLSLNAKRYPLNAALVVVAVPLARRRLNWRGFNQSEIIAQKISQYFGWPADFEILKRSRHCRAQADIKDKNSRIKNVSGIFVCSKPRAVSGKQILLIDDVATTSSTLDDCARALKTAGASEVVGFVFARGKPK